MERHFDEELSDLKKEILKMGALVEEPIYRAVEALKALDADKAKQVISDDQAVDELELKIEEQCLDLVALRQPMAFDLRFIIMAMKITNELERMADLGVDIAQRVLAISNKPHLKPLVDIPKLTQIAKAMTHDVIDAFLNKDVTLAGKVIQMDTEADKLRNLIQEELIKDYMEKNTATVSRAVPLLLIARHLERICDHATNIAEEVIYMSSAKVVKHHPEKLAGE